MAKTEPQERFAKRKKRKLKAKSQMSYSFVLLILMLVVGCISGLVAFIFGQQALQGVNPIPLGGQLPKPPVPPEKPSNVPPEKPSKKATTNSFLYRDRHTVVNAQMPRPIVGSNAQQVGYINISQLMGNNSFKVDALTAQQARSLMVSR